MGIQLSGFNSGLPVNDIISQLMALERKPIELLEQRVAKIQLQQGVYSNVESRVKDLLLAVEKITKRSITDNSSVFDANSAKSSDDKIATATASKEASPQNITLEVKSLPSQTKASSTAGVGRFDNATLVSDLGVTAGSFSIYVNGLARAVNVAAGDNIGTVLGNIVAAGGPEITSASIVDGKIQLQYVDGETISLGSGGDTSNFLAKTHLLTGINNAATDIITASQRNTTISTTAMVSDAAANIATPVIDGTFTINGVSFDSTGKSLGDLITEINDSAAGVTASFNMGNNTFELKAKSTGSALIGLSDGTGNFLTAMNLISGGNSTASQTAGNNTEFVLNGVTMYSTSTTVDETIHGITGVTLDLKKAAPGTTIQIDVAKDKDSLKTLVKDFVDKYNKVISYIDEQTNAEKKGALVGDSRIKSLRSQLRTMISSGVSGLSGTAYDSLQQVGIGTAASTGGATPTLILDEAKLSAALDADPDAVKKLFIGQDLTGADDGTALDDNADGVLAQMNRLIDDSSYTFNTVSGFGALYNGPSDTDKGLFPTYQVSAKKRIDDLNKSITKSEERLERKEKMLRQQFTAMEKIIGQFQAQGNALTGLQQQLSANK